MKVYTKTGDTGSTSLIGGKRVPKYHERIEVYGNIDELISYVGLLRDLYEVEESQQNLIWIQDRLMVCASVIATECEECPDNLPVISETFVLRNSSFSSPVKILRILSSKSVIIFILPSTQSEIVFS